MLFRKKLFRKSIFSKARGNIYDGNGKYNSDKNNQEKSKETNQIKNNPQLKSVAAGGRSDPTAVKGSTNANALLVAKLKCNENHQNWSEATLALILQSELPAGSPKGAKRSRQSSAGAFSSENLRIDPSHPAFKNSLYCGTSDQSRANQFKRFEKYMNKRNRRTGAILQSIKEVESEEDEMDL